MNIDVQGIQVPVELDRVDADTALIRDKLEQYMQGERIIFDEPVDLSDLTPFQQRVIEAIRTIPYGDTVTYTELAEQAGNPAAVRAVANACGCNPVPLIIPCHRVVAKNGLGGYAEGIAVKEALLNLEKIG